MKKGIKEIVCDFDGVFADSTGHCANEIQTIGESLTGIRLDIQTLLSEWGIIFEQFLEHFYPGVTLERYLKERSRLGFDRYLPPRIPGARRTIEILSTAYPLSIITNRERGTLDQILSGLEIDRSKFKFIQSCSETEFHKPDRRVFDRFMETVDARASLGEIMYVGDLLVDHAAANARGFQFAGVLSGNVVTHQ